MGNMYRILIEGGDGETVADLTAPVEMLAQFAPEAVARLLREATPEAEGDTPAAPRFTDAEPVRRKRRTKAEMEAARVRTAAEIRQAEGGERADQYEANDPLRTTDDQAAPAPAGGGRGPEPEVYNPFG